MMQSPRDLITEKFVRYVCIGMLSAVVTSSCDSTSRAPRLQFIDSPEILEIADAEALLVRLLRAETNVPSRLDITLSDGEGHTVRLQFDDVAQAHDQPILGLRAERNYVAWISATSVAGDSAQWPQELSFQTDPLPSNFAPIEVLSSEPEVMEPGYTLFNISGSPRSPGGTEPVGSYLVIVDNAGEVVWYRPGFFINVIKQSNGRLLAMTSPPNRIVEIDMFGVIHRSWHASVDEGPDDSIPVESGSFHHEAIWFVEEESFLTLGRQHRLVEAFPVDESDPTRLETVMVRDEPVLHISTDGSVLGRWGFLDILKPTRIGFNGARGAPDSADWVHANAVIYDNRDDSFIASLRHQDAVVKFSRQTGELLWILGPHANWEGFEQHLLSPLGSPFAWSYHQHAPELTPQGSLLLFDNGNSRASPFTGEVPLTADANWSRAVEYAIDERTMTVEQLWEWGLPQSGEQLYAPFVGDADLLEKTGNVLISYAGLCHENGVPSDSIRSCQWSVRIIEVHRTDPNRIVFDLRVADPTGSIRWRSYRSERIQSLYPAGL